MVPISIVTLSTIRNKRVSSIRIPVRIIHNGRKIDAQALLDSSTEGIYCNATFVKSHGFPLQPLQNPIYPRNVDGTINTQGAIKNATMLQMEMGTRHTELTNLFVTNTGDHNILLGTDWLSKHNPNINWATNTITLNRCPNTCFKETIEPIAPLLAQLLPVCDWDPLTDEFFEIDETYADRALCIESHMDKYFDGPLHGPLLARTTVSTTLAMKKEALRTDIPPEFQQYSRVFSDKEAQRLPKHQLWDHKIDLLPDKSMRKTSIYRLTPLEKVALEKYITNGLTQGSLCRSEAPDACSFFFIDKKDGKLHLVQDYRPLNDITRKNAAPIPLIPELVDKLLGVWFFTKLDVRWEYNNIRIQEGDEWKATFKTPLGLFEPTVMTFGLCNAPATF